MNDELKGIEDEQPDCLWEHCNRTNHGCGPEAIYVGLRHAFVLPEAVGRILRRSERDSRNRMLESSGSVTNGSAFA